MNISWESVRSFGNSHIVKSNYLWLFIIPFLAKNMGPINEYFHLNIEITFNISRFFYASLSFAIGTLIYQLRCPDLIKNHDGYADFDDKGKTLQHIVEYCQIEQRKFFSELTFDNIRNYLLTFDIDKNKNNKLLVSILNPKGKVECLYIDNSLDKNFFWETYDKLKKINRIAATISFVSYSVGCLFLLIVSVENIIYALKGFLL